MTPVVERLADCPFWPDDAGSGSHLPVTADAGRVAAVAWSLVAQGTNPDREAATGAVEAVEAFLALDDGSWYASGGLRVASDGVVVDPGCCAELGEWRAWLDVLRGEAIWLGHQPDVVVEHRGPVVRLWQDLDVVAPGSGGPDSAGPGSAGPHVDFPRDALPVLLRGVRRDLLGFLDALGVWARDVVPTLADRLVATVDRRLVVSPPLDL